jgi:hypothetical protein
MTMDKRHRYEEPLLIDLKDDVTCKGASCSVGDNISFYGCVAGSCASQVNCHTGFVAECCGNGSNACAGEMTLMSVCGTGTGVKAGTNGMWDTYACHTSGAYACEECTSGNQAGGIGCGCGGNNGGSS